MMTASGVNVWVILDSCVYAGRRDIPEAAMQRAVRHDI